MDSIHIRKISLECIIGVEPREREQKQNVLVSVVLRGDFRKAGRSDCLEDSVDYAMIRDRIAALVEDSRFHIIEALAQAVADICLGTPRVEVVDVVVEKPAALSGCGGVAVEIQRSRTP